MKILLIGLGSIGKRHLQNILFLGYNQITVVSRSAQLPEPFSHVTVFPNLQQALSHSQYSAAILCTPTACHYPAILDLLTAQVPKIYIEKPVSHQLEGFDKIFKLAAAYPNKIVVGYDLHFDPGLQHVKNLLQSKAIGQIASINAQVGQYLPDWRPYEDYRQGMSAKKATGGGVMLDLVHEFDYVLWLVGKVAKVGCFYTNTGALTIETEDVCDVLLQFETGATGTIHLDYLQQKLVRNCLITGFEGSIYWNLAASEVSWIDKDKKEHYYTYVGFERNDRFIKIMQAFLSDTWDAGLTTLAQGVESLLLVNAAKYSGDTGKFVEIKNFTTDNIDYDFGYHMLQGRI